jgi:hypothetical protein
MPISYELFDVQMCTQCPLLESCNAELTNQANDQFGPFPLG